MPRGRPWWPPRGVTRAGQALPVPLASSATWRIPSPPVEAYRPLLRVPLTGAVGQAVVSGSGAARVAIGPQALGTRWYPGKVDLSTSTGVNDASTVTLYAGTVALANLIGGTSYLGGGDTIGINGMYLDPGDLLIAVWAGGNPGDNATMRVTGSQVVMVA